MSGNSNHNKFSIFKRRSLAVELIISLFLLVIVLEGTLLAYIYRKEAQILLQELGNKADDYSNYLKAILVVPIWDYDDEQIEIIGTGFANNNLVDEIHIMNSDRQSLYKYNNPETISSESQIKRSVNIVYNNKTIGFAELQLSIDAYKTDLAWLRNSIIPVIMGSIFVILITTGFLLRYLMRNPIMVLQRGINKVASGDYEYKFDDVHHLELSGIAVRIKKMARIIQKRESSLQRMNEELKKEITIRKREATEKLRLEKKLLQANKMEALGTLAGGVAHDLNNILSGIVSYPDLLLMDVADDSPLRKPIQTIKRSGEKAATIVQDLLTLARRGVAVQEIVNLNDIILQYLNSPEFNLLKVENSKVFIETDLAGNLFNIKGSPVHLSKSVMNLISNAMEAMPDGGKITIKTENKYIDLPIEGYDDIEEGDYVSFTISDSGVGISSDDLNRIFEPFYTKKVMGRSGTGLGMAVVWGTVKDHRGYLDIQSVEGKGTEFKIYFPVTRQQETDAKIPLSLEELKGNGESILIVDDVPDQREIAKAILSKLGYQAAAVASGEDAVEYLKKNETDLLILDMIMEPGMDGLEAYREIIKFRPKQKAIIASGFSETERVKEAQRLGAGLYLKKPYNLEKIGAAVKEEIGCSRADHA